MEGEIVVNRRFNSHIWFEIHLVNLVTPPLPESLFCEHITPSWEGFSGFPVSISLKPHWFLPAMDQTSAVLGFPTPDPNFYISFGLGFRIQLALSLALEIFSLLSPQVHSPGNPWKAWAHIYRAQLCMRQLRGKSRIIQQNTASGTLLKHHCNLCEVGEILTSPITPLNVS